MGGESLKERVISGEGGRIKEEGMRRGEEGKGMGGVRGEERETGGGWVGGGGGDLGGGKVWTDR